VAAFARPSRWKRLVAQAPPTRTICAWALTLAGIAAAAWMIVRVFPVLAVREALLANRTAVIAAGPRDASFFVEGWSGRVTTYNVTARVARSEPSIVDVPLPRRGDYEVTLRLDPFPPPSGDTEDLPSVRILLNGVLLRTIRLTWNPERVGSYDVVLKKALVRPGLNRIMFVGEAGAAADATADVRRSPRSYKLWYVLVRPAPASHQ